MPVLPAILPLLILNNGYSYLAAGLLITAYNVTSSFTQPVLGWLSDTRGLSVDVSISLLISAVFVALMGIASTYSMIMLFAVLAALGLACSIPAFYLFYVSSGMVAIIAIFLFGFALWSTFAVAVAMSLELLPRNVGLASGIMLGLAIGLGGLGVAVNGILADQYSLAAALGTIPIPIAGAVLLMIVLPYPWKSLNRHFNRISVR